MFHSEEVEDRQTWMWVALTIGAAVGAFGLVYLLLRRNPTHRLDRLLRRCEDRIHNIEGSLAELESTLSPSRA